MSEKFGFEKKDRPNFSKILLNLMNLHEEKLSLRPDYEIEVHGKKTNYKI